MMNPDNHIKILFYVYNIYYRYNPVPGLPMSLLGLDLRKPLTEFCHLLLHTLKPDAAREMEPGYVTDKVTTGYYIRV